MVSENLNHWSGFLLVHAIGCVQKAVYSTSGSVLNTCFQKKVSQKSKVKFSHDESFLYVSICINRSHVISSLLINLPG